MQRLSLIVALLACLSVAGCAPSASEKLVGKWEYDRMADAQEGSGDQDFAGRMREAAVGVAEAAAMKLGMEVEFKTDQTVTMSVSLFGAKTSGRIEWEVVKVEGETATVEIRRPDGQYVQRLQITFVDDDHIRIAPPGNEGKSLAFARVKQE